MAQGSLAETNLTEIPHSSERSFVEQHSLNVSIALQKWSTEVTVNHDPVEPYRLSHPGTTFNKVEIRRHSCGNRE